MKLRLLVTRKCDRNCRGCCNKDWDIENLPAPDLTKQYDEILITGGEPLLNPVAIKDLCIFLKRISPTTKIYIYTALQPGRKNADYDFYQWLFQYCDGITLTLHTKKDGKQFFNSFFYDYPYEHASLRLNVFKGIEIPRKAHRSWWKIKKNITWIKNCPLPKDEDFCKLILF